MSDLAQSLSWPRDEAELVTELQSGSESAFDWLVTHYHGPVFGLIAGLVGDAGEAADITQEVFLKAFRGLGSFRRGSSLRTWLYRIAVREALYMGTPVIATDNRMRPEGVHLIPPSDPARLLDAVCDLLSRRRAPRPPAGDGQENIRAVVHFYEELLG